jgi:hypothetical protein
VNKTPPTVTIPQLAARVHRPRQTLARIARRLGIAKLGRDYHLTTKQANSVLANLQETSGRPKKAEKSRSRKG